MSRSHASFRRDLGTTGRSALGLQLAEGIVEGLRARGIPASEASRDGGLARATVTVDGQQLELSVEPLDEAGYHNWLVRLEARKGKVLRRIGLRRDPESTSANVLHDVLTTDLGLRPHWFSASEWNDPRCEVGATIPA